MSNADNQIFRNNGPTNNVDPTMQQTNTLDLSSSRTLGFVFLYMAIGVGITALISGVGGYFLYDLFLKADEVLAGQLIIGYIIAMVVSFLVILVIPLVINGIAKKRSVAVWVPYILYSIAFGVFLSMFAFLIPPQIMGMAFGITTIIYVTMAIIGIVSKGKMRILGQIAIGLGVGAMVLLGIAIFLVLYPSIFVSLIWGSDVAAVGFDMYWWIILGVLTLIFLYSAITTIIDVNRLKKSAALYQYNQSEIVFYAYLFYGNYVIMLMYVLRILAIIFARRR